MWLQESGRLVQGVAASCEVTGLQAVPALVSKCLQLQETLAVRFGVMLVGPAGRLAQHQWFHVLPLELSLCYSMKASGCTCKR